MYFNNRIRLGIAHWTYLLCWNQKPGCWWLHLRHLHFHIHCERDTMTLLASWRQDMQDVQLERLNTNAVMHTVPGAWPTQKATCRSILRPIGLNHDNWARSQFLTSSQMVIRGVLHVSLMQQCPLAYLSVERINICCMIWKQIRRECLHSKMYWGIAPVTMPMERSCVHHFKYCFKGDYGLDRLLFVLE